MRIHFIQHETFEAPGAYLDWAKARGYQTAFSHVYLGEALPADAEGFDMLIVLGGPQSPAEDKVNFPYYQPAAEQRVIQQAINAQKAVIGVCLGAQLIGASFGAGFSHSPNKEIGNFPIFLTESAKNDAKIRHFGEKLNVGHWHNDMPNLPENAEILAYSEGCPRQIVRFSDLVYGFQCHLEFSPSVAQGLIDHEPNLAAFSQTLPFVQSAATMLNFDYQEMNAALWEFLDKLTAAYLAKSAK